MTLTYTLDSNDYLQYQLFCASKNGAIKQQRRKSWLIFSFSVLLLSFIFYESHNNFMAIYLLIFGLVILFFFPFYQAKYYRNHYLKHITNTYTNRFELINTVNFNDDYIEAIDKTGESKINNTVVENITETGNYFYVKMQTGGHLIIPKLKIDNIDHVRAILKSLSVKLSIDFISDLNWKWT